MSIIEQFQALLDALADPGPYVIILADTLSEADKPDPRAVALAQRLCASTDPPQRLSRQTDDSSGLEADIWPAQDGRARLVVLYEWPASRRDYCRVRIALVFTDDEQLALSAVLRLA